MCVFRPKLTNHMSVPSPKLIKLKFDTMSNNVYLQIYNYILGNMIIILAIKDFVSSSQNYGGHLMQVRMAEIQKIKFPSISSQCSLAYTWQYNPMPPLD